ncbi:MAG: glycosyltransferase family 4 protein, partial [Candidatus Marsarchaeota archaeon]|nr:glycosyltransferase family 4 protein [Candidatus Marsarchaeota archaeon]
LCLLFSLGEKYVVEFINRLKDFDVTIFSYRGREPFRLSLGEVKKLTKAKIEYYDAFEIPIAKERVMFTGSGRKTIRKLRDFDVVYCLDNSLITNCMLVNASKKYGFRYILGIHDANILRASPIKGTLPRKVLLGIYGPIRNHVILKAPNIRVINEADGKKLRDIGYKGELYSITDFINVSGNGRTPSANGKRFVALFVGRLSIVHKGIDLLSDIIEKSLALDGNMEFRIIGSGDDGEGQIKGLASKYPKNVKWLGFVSEKRLIEEYRNASVLVFPSRFESFGLSLAEGQGYGLPAVAFDVRGPDVIIQDRRQGVLVRPFDTSAFADSILDYRRLWSKDKKEYGRLKSRISEIMLKRFGEETIFPKLESMLKGK